MTPPLSMVATPLEKRLLCNTKEESFVKDRIPEPEVLNEKTLTLNEPENLK